MTIIKISPNENGGHCNQTTSTPIPVSKGWAIIPDGMETPNFPFGDITVDNQNPPVVTRWTCRTADKGRGKQRNKSNKNKQKGRQNRIGGRKREKKQRIWVKRGAC